MGEEGGLNPLRDRVEGILKKDPVTWEKFGVHVDLLTEVVGRIETFNSLRWGEKVRARLRQDFPGPENKALRGNLYRLIGNLHAGLRGMEGMGVGMTTEADRYLGPISSTGAREKGW